jgi:hypothetical protein
MPGRHSPMGCILATDEPVRQPRHLATDRRAAIRRRLPSISRSARRAGSRWGLPPSAPTEPDVLTLEHPVPQPTDSPPPKGPRGDPSESRGHADEPRCVRHVSLGRACRRLASLHGVLRGEFPRSRGTIKALRLPAARPAALRCLRWAVPPRPLVRFAPRRTSAPSGPGVVDPVSPAGSSLRRRQDLASSWGTPIVRSPCSVDAGGTAGTRPLRCRSVALGIRTAKAPTKGLSALNSMAFGLAVCPCKSRAVFLDFLEGCSRPLWTTRSLTLWILSVGLISCPLEPAHLWGSCASQGRSGTEPIG